MTPKPPPISKCKNSCSKSLPLNLDFEYIVPKKQTKRKIKVEISKPQSLNLSGFFASLKYFFVFVFIINFLFFKKKK